MCVCPRAHEVVTCIVLVRSIVVVVDVFVVAVVASVLRVVALYYLLQVSGR